MLKKVLPSEYLFMEMHKTSRPYKKDTSKATNRASNIRMKVYQNLHQIDGELDFEE